MDESAITGESAPVIRESGGDRSASPAARACSPTGSWSRITANPGETFLDRMIAMVEGAKRQKTPNEIALDILLAALTIIFLIVCVTLLALLASTASQAARQGTRSRSPSWWPCLVCLIPTTIGGLLSAIGIAGMDRMIQANVIAMSRPRGGGGGRRGHAAAGQDRHHHPGQPPGRGVHPRPGRGHRRTWRRRRSSSSLADETPEGRSIVVLAKEKYGLRGRSIHEHAATSCPSPPRPA